MYSVLIISNGSSSHEIIEILNNSDTGPGFVLADPNSDTSDTNPFNDHMFIHPISAKECIGPDNDLFFIDNDLSRQLYKKFYYEDSKLSRLPISLKNNNKNIQTKNYKPLPRNRLWRFRVKRPSKSFSY